MSGIQAWIVLSNLEHSEFQLATSELVYAHLLYQRFETAVLDPEQIFQPVEWQQQFSHPWKKNVRKTLLGKVPYIGSDQIFESNKSKSKESWSFLKESTVFLVLKNLEVRYLPDFPLPVLCLIKNSSETPSFLFNCLQNLQAKWGNIPASPTIMWNVEFIETAAESFAKITQEIRKITQQNVPFDFVGHLNTLEEKLKIKRFYPGHSLIDIFPEDQFHGQLKRIVPKLASYHQKIATLDWIIFQKWAFSNT